MRHEAKVLSPASWEATARHWVNKTLAGLSDRAIGVTPDWIQTREIRILWEAGITHSTAELVAGEIRALLCELNLGAQFRVVLMGTGWREGVSWVSTVGHIRPALRANGFDMERLFQLSYHEHYRQAYQHADVYILKRPFHDDRVSWGASRFEHGSMVLTLHGDRQHNRRFLKGVVRHEMGHLLGMPIHCEMIGHQDYTYNPQCNMHYMVPSHTLCPKCERYLKLWWRTLIQSGASH